MIQSLYSWMDNLQPLIPLEPAAAAAPPPLQRTNAQSTPSLSVVPPVSSVPLVPAAAAAPPPLQRTNAQSTPSLSLVSPVSLEPATAYATAVPSSLDMAASILARSRSPIVSRSPEPRVARSSTLELIPRLTRHTRIGFNVVYSAIPKNKELKSENIGYGVMFVSHGSIYKRGSFPISSLRVPELSRENFSLYDPLIDECVLSEYTDYDSFQYIDAFSNLLPAVMRNRYDRREVSTPKFKDNTEKTLKRKVSGPQRMTRRSTSSYEEKDDKKVSFICLS